MGKRERERERERESACGMKGARLGFKGGSRRVRASDRKSVVGGKLISEGRNRMRKKGYGEKERKEKVRGRKTDRHAEAFEAAAIATQFDF